MKLKKNINFKIFLTFLFVLIFFISCDKKKKNYQLKTKDIEVDTNTLILKGVNFYNTKSGKIAWNLTADKAKINKEKQIAELTKVVVNFKNQNFKALSDKGIYNLKNKNGKLFKNVTLEGKEWKILTDSAEFNNAQKKIIIDRPFKFKGKNFFLKGSKMVAFIDKKKFIIKGRVFSIWKKDLKK